MADKPRILTSGKDMIWTMVPLVVICVVIAAAAGSCSFGFGGPTVDDRTQAFDVATALRTDARDLPFPIRQPPTPAGWKPNSGSTQASEGHRISNVGWLTGNGAYVQLSQTDASEEVLASFLAGTPKSGSLPDFTGTGTRQIGDRTWVTYITSEKRKFWITDLRDVRIAVLSRASDADLEQIAGPVVAAAPLPVDR